MTTYTAPPNTTGLTLFTGDTLYVESGGTATATVVEGGNAIVDAGGATASTTIISGDELVRAGGAATGTLIEGGTLSVFGAATTTLITSGDEIVGASGVDTNTTIIKGDQAVYGSAIHTTIQGGDQTIYGAAAYAIIISGSEIVETGGKTTGTAVLSSGLQQVFGTATDTTIAGGVEHVYTHGTADNITFAGASSTLDLADPHDLIGAIYTWQVGDVIDFLNTDVTGVHVSGETLTVTYDTSRTASYLLEGQQPNTEFLLQSDHHGGTELILTPVTRS
jgi:autotransporter passenger strand-loop-strand repeat protein